MQKSKYYAIVSTFILCLMVMSCGSRDVAELLPGTWEAVDADYYSDQKEHEMLAATRQQVIEIDKTTVFTFTPDSVVWMNSVLNDIDTRLAFAWSFSNDTLRFSSDDKEVVAMVVEKVNKKNLVVTYVLPVEQTPWRKHATVFRKAASNEPD